MEELYFHNTTMVTPPMMLRHIDNTIVVEDDDGPGTGSFFFFSTHSSINVSKTLIGTAPFSRMTRWKSRMSNLEPAKLILLNKLNADIPVHFKNKFK